MLLWDKLSAAIRELRPISLLVQGLLGASLDSWWDFLLLNRASGNNSRTEHRVSLRIGLRLQLLRFLLLLLLLFTRLLLFLLLAEHVIVVESWVARVVRGHLFCKAILFHFKIVLFFIRVVTTERMRWAFLADRNRHSDIREVLLDLRQFVGFVL